MRKFILPIVLGLAFLSCKKTTTDEVQAEQTSADKASENQNQTGLREFSPAEVTEMLQTKNDTMYVANFFATWCGPCVREIPHFREVMEETKGQPVKFVFINLDEKSDWDSEVVPFADKHKIKGSTILLDGGKLASDFYSDNFQTWGGEFIPFTFIRKGNKTEEISGGISKEILENKMKAIQ